MTRFVKFTTVSTNASPDGDVWVNPAFVVAVSQDPQWTVIQMVDDDNFYRVAEDAETVASRLQGDRD